MTSELAGIGGYASLMRTQKNPYERNITTTQGVINSMPKDGGVTGLERLGTIPLMYQMGQDTANAQQFDEQKAVEEKQQLQGVMAYQQSQDAAKMKLEQDKAAVDATHKNAQSIQEALKSATALAQAGNEGEAVKLLRQNGIPVQNFKVIPNGFQAMGPDGKYYMLQANETGDMVPHVWDGKAWTVQTDAAQKPETPIPGAHVKTDVGGTGYGYIGTQGSVYGDAPTPSELHPRPAKEAKPVDLAATIKRVILPGGTNHTVFDVSKPDMAEAYKQSLLQGGKDVTAEVSRYNTTEGRDFANNENPRPGKTGVFSSQVTGSRPVPASKSSGVDTTRPVQKGGIVGYRQADGSVLDASGRRLN